MILLAAWLSVAPARAESADTLPDGSATVYAGGGLGTFEYGASGLERDRQWRARVDLYAAVGVTDRLQLSLDGPLAYHWVGDKSGIGPCPTGGYEGDYCDPVATAGEVGLRARYRVLGGPVKIVGGLGARGDPWNADTRGRWTNAGLGTGSLVGSVIGGWDAPSGGGGVVGSGHYRLTLGRLVDAGLGEIRLPVDEVSGAIEGYLLTGGWRFGLGAGGVSRLGGVEYGDDYVDYYRRVQDRWASLRYRALRAEARASRSISEVAGFHLSVGRVLVAANGPKDSMDVSLGAHRYFPSR